MDGETKTEVYDEEIVAVMNHVASLDLTTGLAPQQLPPGMTQARFQFLTLRLLQQQSGDLFASLEDVFQLEWSQYSKEDFDLLCRNEREHVIEDKTVKLVYDSTRLAARVTENRMSASPNTMRVNGATPARLCGNQTKLLEEAAHLCPKSGPEGKVDTWIYVAKAVLGITNEDPSVLMKCLRGSYPPLSEAKDDKKKDGNKKESVATIDNTGLNRAPSNLLYMMSQKYVFDLTPSVFALPVLTVDEAKAWNGSPYPIIVLCDDENLGRATHQQVAQAIGLTMTNAEPASVAEIEKATSLLKQVLRFSAYALENKPPPPTTKGNALWSKYGKQLKQARALFHSIKREGTTQELRNKVATPVRINVDAKVVAKVDLGKMNRDTESEVVYPDPILLAMKTSVNWTRKFAFQMIAEADQADDSFLLQDFQDDSILGKSLEFSSHGDSSHSWEID